MNQKKHMISARLTEPELQRLNELRQISGLSVSRIIRKWIAGEKLQPRRPEEIHDLYVEINRIGTNINQIARKANAGFATKDDVRQLKFLMRTIEEKVSVIANRRWPLQKYSPDAEVSRLRLPM